MVAAAQAVWAWAQQWGHLILDVIAAGTVFLSGPLFAVGLAAAAANATWHAIEGDYAMAGLSLAAVVPGLTFAKLARGSNAASASAKSAQVASNTPAATGKSTEVAKRAKLWRPLKPFQDCDLARRSGGITVKYRKNWTRSQRKAANKKVAALSEAAGRNELKKTATAQQSQAPSVLYKRATGKNIPPNKDIDHIIERQLGGSDDISNLAPLDKRVNRSLGKQIADQLTAIPIGAPVPAVAICS